MEYKLKELFDLQMGKTPSRNNSDYWNTKDNKWISIADLSKCEKYITDTKEYISDIAIKESGINPIPANTVVMSFKLSIGKTAITKEVIYSNEAIMSFRDKKTIELLPDYTYYLMMSKRWDEGSNKAVMGKTLNKATLSEIKVSVHDIAEQQRIVNVLDKLTTLIDKRKKQLKKLDELVKSRFVEMFGDRYVNDKNWNTMKLGDSISFNNGKAHEQVVDKNGEYILVTSRAIASDFKDVRRTNELLFPLHKNDIVMVMSDVPNGKALAKCQLIDENNKYTLNQRICSFDNYNYNPVFLLFLLSRHPYFLSFNDGNGQTNLRKNDILDCELIYPPIELQNQFATFVKQVDKSKFEIKQSLEKLELLKKSLMQKYFG